MKGIEQKLETVIRVKDVRRSFRSSKKEEGIKGTLGLLFNPQYSTHEALKGVNFSIESGAFVGLIGANGAGKTTLLKILSGLIPPSSGEAEVLGYNPFQRPISFRKQISLVMGQKAQLWWDLPARDAFDLLQAIYEVPKPLYRERVAHLAKLLGVTQHLQTQIRRLSLGERMKMELIGALIHWPKVIFLDEPTIGLDVLAAHRLREFLQLFNREEKATIILTSHNMEDIEKLCSRILILRNGELIYDGAPRQLKGVGDCRLRVRLVQSAPKEELSRLTGISVDKISIEDDSDSEMKTIYFGLPRDQIVTILQAMLSKFQLVDMGIEEENLENVIQRMYEGSEAKA